MPKGIDRYIVCESDSSFRRTVPRPIDRVRRLLPHICPRRLAYAERIDLSHQFYGAVDNIQYSIYLWPVWEAIKADCGFAEQFFRYDGSDDGLIKDTPLQAANMRAVTISADLTHTDLTWETEL